MANARNEVRDVISPQRIKLPMDQYEKLREDRRLTMLMLGTVTLGKEIILFEQGQDVVASDIHHLIANIMHSQPAKYSAIEAFEGDLPVKKGSLPYIGFAGGPEGPRAVRYVTELASMAIDETNASLEKTGDNIRIPEQGSPGILPLHAVHHG